jgi:mannitol 2-dehydrogenase
VSYDDYRRLIAERFSSPDEGDTIPRLCFDGSSRQPKFIQPVAQRALAEDLPLDGLALEVALWCRYCAGPTDTSELIPPTTRTPKT